MNGGFVRIAIAVVIGGAVSARGQELGPHGWTVLEAPPGARVVYVSSSQGSDMWDGVSQDSAVRTLARGYELLRDGHPDQMLLRCGDMWKESLEDWQKSADSLTQYMLVGSYGTGPRPRIESGESAGFSGPAWTPRRGLAIVGLEFVASGLGKSESAGIELLESWENVLIEDCHVSRYRDNIAVVPLTAEGRSRGIRIRRSVIVDSYHTGPAHSQGIFLGNCDDWLIEECVLDRNGVNRQTIFCHNVYIHEGCGPGVFRRNVSARACSHGVQLRPGGIAENNLLLQNPVSLLIGRSAVSPTEDNKVWYNVILDGRDINPQEPRAQGIEVSDVGRARVEWNIIAHQKTGKGNVNALAITRSQNVTVKGNVAFDWTRPGEETGVSLLWAGDCGGSNIITKNRLVQTEGGVLVAHALDSPYLPSFRYFSNEYFSINPIHAYLWFANDGAFLSNPQWVMLTGEVRSTFGPVTFPHSERTIEAYAKSLGAGSTLEGFLAEARRQSRGFWRSDYTAGAANAWFRQGFGVYCPADVNRDGVHSAEDFAAFQGAFQAGSPEADMNGDGVLNILDYLAFLSASAEGCP